jgi:hypothetical protein
MDLVSRANKRSPREGGEEIGYPGSSASERAGRTMISPQEIGGGFGVFALLLGTLAADRGSGIYTRGSSGEDLNYLPWLRKA